MKKFLLIVFFVLLHSVCFATDYYVKNAGDDENTGLSDEQAWETISKVNGEAFSPGDNIYFNKGDTWNEQLTIPDSGSDGSPITIDAYGSGANPIINGGDTRDYGIEFSGRDYITIKNIHIKDTVLHGIRGYNSDYAIVNSCEVQGAGQGSQPQGSGGSNIYIYGDYAWIHDNTIHDCDAEHGIYMGRDSDYSIIEDNILYGNDDTAIKFNSSIEQLTVRPIIRNNVMGNTGSEYNNIMLNDTTGAIVHGNLMYDTGSYCRPITIQDDGPGPDAVNMRVFNNTMKGGYVVNIEIEVGSGGVFKNNIIYNDGGYATDHLIEIITGASATLDYNQYYAVGGYINAFFYHGSDYDSLSAWQSASGQDSNSQASDPLFNNPDNDDYTLASNSPAINNGTWLTTTLSSGSGTQVTVSDASYFTDGHGVTAGSIIQFQGQTATYEVIAVSYPNSITLSSSAIWSSGLGVALEYSGVKPDMGAFEYEEIEQFTHSAGPGTINQAGAGTVNQVSAE